MQHRLFSALSAAFVIALGAPGCVSAQHQTAANAERPPEAAAPMFPMFEVSVPSEVKTKFFVNDAEGQARAEQLIEIYNVLSTDPRLENVREHISDEYIQHNPMLPDGPGPLSMLFSQSVSQFPMKIDVHKIAIVGDFGMAHVNFRNLDNNNPNDLGTAAVDMYYWGKDGKIIEHWDVLQTVPAQSSNPNTMFLMLSGQETD